MILLKSTPYIGPRYWTAMLVASMCGANIGDVFPDILHVGHFEGLLALAASFVVVVVIDRRLASGLEGLYWVSVLTVRGAATSVADFSIQDLHLGCGLAILILAVILGAFVAWYRRTTESPVVAIRGTGQYWATMLAAGSLGTLIADALGHAFGPVSTGVPISAAMATIALIGARLAWRRGLSQSVFGYWLAIVLVRWWGTNVGDITAFLLSLPVSTVGTAVVMTLILTLWPPPARITQSRTVPDATGN